MIAVLVFVAALAAFAVSAVAGGGAGLVLVPLLRLLVPIASVPAALSLGTAASAVSRVALFRAAIRWDVVVRFVPTALPAAALGAWLLTRFEPAYAELLIALFLLANLPALFRAAPAEGDVRPLSPAMLPWLGAAAGLLSGFTGAVGLAFNGAYRRLGLDRHAMVATRATNEVLIHLLKLAIYAAFGLLTRPALVAGGIVAVAAILASFVARRWLAGIGEGPFRRIGQLAMVAAGVAMFALSGATIARLHRVWIALVAPGGEREARLIVDGHPVAAAEIESEGYLAIERSVALAALPPAVRARIATIAAPAEIDLIERVSTPRGVGYEVHYRRAGKPGEAEFPAP